MMKRMDVLHARHIGSTVLYDFYLIERETMWAILATTAVLIVLSWFVLGMEKQSLDRRDD